MNLINTSLLNAAAVSIRILSMLALNKVLAVAVGPSGYALIGQLQNAITALTAVASAGVGTGVTKYTAEHGDDPAAQRRIWVTACVTGLAGALILGLAVIVLHQQLAQFILKDGSYGTVFVWVGACLGLFVLNTLLLAILNGRKEIRLFVAANILNSLVALAVTGLLAYTAGLKGALIALAINQSVCCFFTIWLCRKTTWFQLDQLFGRPSGTDFRRLSHYTAMAFVTSAVGPLALIAVRNVLLHRFGAEAAGYWEALTRISNLYLMFITTPLSVYYLPRLAELKDTEGLRKEIVQGYRLLLPITIAGALSVYLLRDWIVTVLFSEAFRPMSNLFTWQLVGDVLRIMAWLLSFFLLSRTMTVAFLGTELLFNACFIAFSWLFTLHMGVQGATLAYACSYLMYIIVTAPLVAKKIRRGPSRF